MQQEAIGAEGLDALMAIKYAKGGPSKRKKRGSVEYVPERFDLDNLKTDEPAYLPGGLRRALNDAARNREHVFRGATWTVFDEQVKPGQWVYAVRGPHTLWCLVYSSNIEQMVIVDQMGGYSLVYRNAALRRLWRVADYPPWWEEWVTQNL